MGASTGMVIDGVLGSEAIDSSGEILDVRGADISDVDAGTMLLNWEHQPGEKGASTIVGKVLTATKVLAREDCETDRQRMYWDKVQVPFIYGICRLFDGAGHEEAKRIAAIIRDEAANGEMLVCRFSVEGSTLDKVDNRLKESVIRRVAVTVKPCNRTANSSLLEDPNAPDGFDKKPVREKVKDLLDFEDAEKNELVDPRYLHLGVSKEIECNPLLDDTDLEKALSAGNSAAAPSTLTGFSALQSENVDRRMHMTTKAVDAMKKYSSAKFSKDEFRAYMKQELPDASDEYLDHFTDIAEDYHVKRSQLKKKEATAPSAKPTSKPTSKKVVAKEKAPKVASKKPAKAKVQIDIPGTEAHEGPTIRGVPIQLNPELKRPVLDENKGVLHTEFGSFPLYNPEPEHFNRILSDPKVEAVHNKAMEGWVKVHKLLKERRLPPEVVMHATLFSQLSPNTPVPMQELMYSHLVDSMHHTGADAREPGFSAKTKADWTSRDRAKTSPQHSGDFFESHPGVHLKNPTDTREVGDFGSFMLANNKMENMNKYHQIHQSLMELVNRHGADARSATGELMDHKHKGQLWEARRRNLVAKGKSDPGAYPGPAVPGLAPKTSRYMLGMLGGGNVFVPDTHMVRHLAGLEQHRDGPTIEKMRALMWNELNSDTLAGIDRWYGKNHVAVKHMLAHPTWGSHFEKPEDAIFPAFWKHWIAIAPDERSRGMRNQNTTEGTTHAPFWSAIDPFVNDANKSEMDESMPQRTARIHAQYVKDYGEVPASMLYYAFLVPHLLDAAEQRAKASSVSFLTKSIHLSNLDIELRKAVASFESHPHLMEPEMPVVHQVRIKIKGREHPAGRFMTANGTLHHLEDYHGLVGNTLPEGPIDDATISRIHGLRMSPHVSISEDPVPEEQKDAIEPSPPTLPTAPPRPPRESVFHYQRAGMDQPHTLEVVNGNYLLDGNKLSYPEAATIVQNVKNGSAQIRYRTSIAEGRIRKMEQAIESLMKAGEDESPLGSFDPAEHTLAATTALQHVRNAVAAGHLDPQVERALTRHIYEDKMTPGMGNKFAYNEFRAKNRPGVYVSMDGNSFRSINNAFGHDAGDSAITTFGQHARKAMDESAGGVGKLFRNGGDEFVAYVPSHEHAAKFARNLSQKLDALPPINGVHKMSMSFGFGLDPQKADTALYEAKKQKFHPVTGQKLHEVGQEPSFVHSLVPGHEGPLPVHDSNAAAVHATLKTPSAQPSTNT